MFVTVAIISTAIVLGTTATIAPDAIDPSGHAADAPLSIELPQGTPYWATLVTAIGGGVLAYARLKHEQKLESQRLSSEQQANSQQILQEHQSAFDEQQNQWMKRQDDLIAHKDQMIADLQATITELQSDLTRLHRDLAQVEARYEERHKQLQHNFEEYKDQREAAFDRIRAENERLRQQIFELQSYLSSEQQANKRIIEQYNNVLQSKKSLDTKVKALEKHIGNTKDEHG